MVENDINNKETCLVVDAMNIKKNIVFNKEDGCYQGFSDYGSGIICSSPDEVASEALVFMLVGLRTYWKYPRVCFM